LEDLDYRVIILVAFGQTVHTQVLGYENFESLLCLRHENLLGKIDFLEQGFDEENTMEGTHLEDQRELHHLQA
jgi:hypothetical protein